MKQNMQDCTVIGIDTAKSSFAIHGADASGKPVLRKTCSRSKLLPFLEKLPRCTVVLETCGGSHHWGREIGRMGHEVKLIPPVYVKPFVKRQKNDANDAAAIVEAATRPTMRSVPVKTVETQSRAMVFRARQLLVRQRRTDSCRTFFACRFLHVSPRVSDLLAYLIHGISDSLRR